MPTDRPSSGNRGSSPVGGPPDRSRGKRIGLILGALVVLVLLALLLSRCNGSGEDDAGSSTSSSAATTSSSTGATEATEATAAGPSTDPSASAAATGSSGGPAVGAAGTVTAGSQSVLDAAATADPAAALAALTGQPVTATAVQVLSVPADEGFWVGTSDTDRVWVQLTGGGESGYQVVQGDTVDFTGTLVAHDPTFAGTVGVDEAAGATQLTTQAQHVEVSKDAVTLSA